jgi:hypothetical protein
MKLAHIKFFLITIGFIFLQSCATQTTQTPPALSSCSLSFNSNSPSQICGWYWGNTFPQCDSVMSAELSRRNLNLSPPSACGTSKSPVPPAAPSTQACSFTFQGNSATQICDWYWKDAYKQCDPVMLAELNRRNLNISPQSLCGTPRVVPSTPPPVTSGCTQNYRSAPAADICRTYWGNLNTPCDPAMREELSARSLIITPPNDCGKPLGTNATPARPIQATTSCGVNDVIAFSNQPIQQLCSIAQGTGACRGAASIAIQGRGFSAGGHSGTCGQPESGRCGQLLARFNAAQNPVVAACSVRTDRTSELGLACRSSINGFLLGRGSSSGLVPGSSCGQPITERELQQVNR